MLEHQRINSTLIECKDDYAKYINKMRLAFSILMKVYTVQQDRDHEAEKEQEVVLFSIQKLMNTFELLRYKYLFNQKQFLKIDQTDSGFVHFSEIMGIQTDIPFKSDKLSLCDDVYDIKENMISFMLNNHEQPLDDLEKMSNLKYLQGLNEHELFLFFNPGRLTLLSDECSDTHRKYSYHWACYDKTTNMPYIYFLEFDQSIESEPLENNMENADRFYDVIKQEGSRVPAAGIVARAIDQRLPDIHPKVLKRICIGPIYSSHFSENIEESVSSVLLYADEGEQFIFHLTEQFVFSEGSVAIKNQGMLSKILSETKVREKFSLPNPESIDGHDMFNELDEQKASMIRKQVIMPHAIHQHIENLFENSSIISFNKEGNINGI